MATPPSGDAATGPKGGRSKQRPYHAVARRTAVGAAEIRPGRSAVWTLFALYSNPVQEFELGIGVIREIRGFPAPVTIWALDRRDMLYLGEIENRMCQYPKCEMGRGRRGDAVPIFDNLTACGRSKCFVFSRCACY